MMKETLLFCVICLCVCLCSCGEYELLEHQKECLRIADSTYKSEIKHLNRISDSICNLQYDKYYTAALDSILPARLEEVINLHRK